MVTDDDDDISCSITHTQMYSFDIRHLFFSFLHFHFYRAMHFSAKRGIAIVCRPSVCL